MLVWQRIAKGTTLSEQDVLNLLNKYKITACELQQQVKYTSQPIKCNNDCRTCLISYLKTDTLKDGFNEVRDEQGSIQLRMW